MQHAGLARETGHGHGHGHVDEDGDRGLGRGREGFDSGTSLLFRQLLVV
jgi:hypothetical protein